VHFTADIPHMAPSLLAQAGRLGLDIARNSVPGFTSVEAVYCSVKRIYLNLYSLLVFAYACFFRPIGKHGSQQDRLDAVSSHDRRPPLVVAYI
jgi:hypothetical protein